MTNLILIFLVLIVTGLILVTMILHMHKKRLSLLEEGLGSLMKNVREHQKGKS